MPIDPQNPPGGPGPLARQAGQEAAGLNKALSDMNVINQGNQQVMIEMVRTLNIMKRELAGNNKELETFGSDFRSIMHDSAALETSMCKIAQLQKTVLKPGSSKNQAVTIIKEMIHEYDRLLTTMNKNQGGGKYVKEITRNLSDMQKALRRVEDQNERTWDHSELKKVNAELQNIHNSVGNVASAMSKVKVKGLREEFHGLGTVIDDAFNNRISVAMRRIPGLGHAMKAMQTHRQFQNARAAVNKFAGDRAAAQHSQAQIIAEERAKAVYARHGRSGLQALKALGHGGTDAVTHGRTTQGQRKMLSMPGINQIREATSRAEGGGGAARQAAGALDKMEVGTITATNIVVGRSSGGPRPGAQGYPYMSRKAQKRLTKKEQAKAALEAAQGSLNAMIALGEETAAAAAAPSILRRRSLKESLAGRRLSLYNTSRAASIGPVSAEDLVGAAGHIGRRGARGGALTTAMDAAKGSSLVDAGVGTAGKLLAVGGTPVAIAQAVVGALIAAHDLVSEQNKKISNGLAGTGIFGGRGSATQDLHGVRRSLLSTSLTGNGLLYGQGLDQNLDIFKTLGEGGIASGRTLRRGIDLNQALDGGQGFHGAIMQNAVLNGHMAGFSQQDSVKQTLKLIEKFGQVTDATKTFFVDLNEFSDMSGITASRIVEMVDNITDQFGDLQKSLVGTVSQLHNVGNASIFMGKRVEETVKGLTKPTEQTTAQRFYGIKNILAAGGGRGMAAGLEAQNQAEKDRINGMLGGYKVAVGRNTHEEIMNAIGADPNDQNKQANMEAYRQFRDRYGVNQGRANDWRTGNVQGLVAGQELGGDSGIEAHGSRMRQFRSVLETAGVSPALIQRIMSGDVSALQQAISSNGGSTGMIMSQAKAVFGSGEDMLKNTQMSGNLNDAGAQLVMGLGRDIAGRGSKGWAALHSDAGKTPQQVEADKAKLKVLARYGQGAGKLIGLKGGETDDVAAKALVDYVATNKDNVKAMGALRATISQGNLITDDMITVNSDLGKMYKEQSDAEKAAITESKRMKEAEVTTSSAEIYARAFRHFFERLAGLLQGIANILEPSKAEKERQAEEARMKAGRDLSDAIGAQIDKLNPTKDQKGLVDEMRKLQPQLYSRDPAQAQAARQRSDQILASLGINKEGIKKTLEKRSGAITQANVERFVDKAVQIREGGLFKGGADTINMVGADSLGKTLSGAANNEERTHMLEDVVSKLQARGIDATITQSEGMATLDLPDVGSLSGLFSSALQPGKTPGISGKQSGGHSYYYIYNGVSVLQSPTVSGDAAVKAKPAPTTKPTGMGN